MRTARRLAALAGLAATVLAACAGTAAPDATSPTATIGPAATAAVSPPSSTPSPAASSSSPATSALPSASAAPVASGTPAAAGTPRPTAAPLDAFWAKVQQGIVAARRLQVDIAGPNAGTLRYEATASATVIEGVVGAVCLRRHLYDGQSGFAALPGTWTCGAPALVAGFRAIGQPADSWNPTLPTDRNRRETVTQGASAWTWRYTSISPYLGGAVSASITLDPATGRITAARRSDPLGETTYRFDYGADFPPIAIPR